MVRRGAAALVAIALVMGLAATPSGAVDGPAGRDLTYAGDGALEIGTTQTLELIDAQDRLTVLDMADGGRRLRRFLPDGAPDPAFTPVVLPGGTFLDSSMTFLDDGTIAVVLATTSPTISVQITHVLSTGAVDTGYAGGGTLTVANLSSLRAWVQYGDGSVLRTEHYWGEIRLERFGPDGARDAGFGTDGLASFPCCGPEPEVPQVQSLVPDSDANGVDHGGAVALVRHRDLAVLVSIAADGTAGSQTPVPEAGWAVDLTAAAVGGYALAIQDQQYETYPSTYRVRHLRPDLTLDTAFGPADAFSRGAALEVVRTPAHVVVASGSGGAVTLSAFTATGLDLTYGDGGRVATTMPASELDSAYWGGSPNVAIAPDGRAMVTLNHVWGPGFFNPYTRYVGQRVTIDAGGRILEDQQENTKVTARAAAAEQRGSAFLVVSSEGGGRIERWVPPRADAVLGPVTAAAAAVNGTDAVVTWQPPAPSPGQKITGYQVDVYAPGAATPTSSVSPVVTTATVPIAAAPAATRIDVRAKGILGQVGPVTRLIVVPPLASFDGFVDQLSQDFAGRPATAAEHAALADLVAAGTVDVGYLVRVAAQTESWRTSVDPVVRLYLAYFNRPPDPSGLRYWVAKRRTGTTIAAISSSFAGSSEFKRTYGALGDRAFVQLVYRNVLGREGDPSGVDYWTRRVAARTTSRGQLMASFSESSEHIRRRSRLVDTIGLYWGMLQRLPTAAEREQWAGSSPAGDTNALAIALLSSPAYLARFP